MLAQWARQRDQAEDMVTYKREREGERQRDRHGNRERQHIRGQGHSQRWPNGRTDGHKHEHNISENVTDRTDGTD